MGNVLQCRVLMLGLDNAGKTCILYALENGTPLRDSKPSIGYTIKEFEKKKCNITVWDVAGKENLRELWKHYYEKSQAVVWVVDSADESRLHESKQALTSVLNDPQLKDIILLVVANKQDLSNALKPQQIKEKLDIEKIAKNHTWNIMGTSATPTLTGMDEGLEWVATSFKEQTKKNKK
jgi:ADP-ribosylation factor protein 6